MSGRGQRYSLRYRTRWSETFYVSEMDFEENSNILRWYMKIASNFKTKKVNHSRHDRNTNHREILTIDENCTVETCVEALTNNDVFGILDLRDRTSFHEQHIRGSTNIKAMNIKTMRCLLPPPGSFIALISDTKKEIDIARNALHECGYVIPFSALTSKNFFEAAKSLDMLIKETHNSKQLWKPSPLLHVGLPLIENITKKNHFTFLDVGAGAGRDLIYTARRGWTSIGVDHLPSHKHRFEEIINILSNEHDEVLDCKYLTIDCVKHPESLPKADIVHIGRFLDRPLILHIRDRIIRRGGFFMIHTFMVGCEKFGTPKKSKFLLKSGELSERFGKKHGWKVLMDEVHPIDDGRPLSYFIAMKN